MTNRKQPAKLEVNYLGILITMVTIQQYKSGSVPTGESVLSISDSYHSGHHCLLPGNVTYEGMTADSSNKVKQLLKRHSLLKMTQKDTEE